ESVAAAEPVAEEAPNWPSLAWEAALLNKVLHPLLPRVLDRFVEGGAEYLVLDVPTGQSLWDAWDEPDATYETRYGYLKYIAEGLHQLHRAGAMLEFIRPDLFVVPEDGRPRLTDLSDLLPLPLPNNPPV